MARRIIAEEEWGRAREYFEHGLSLAEVAKKTGISKGAVGKKANEEGWDKDSPKRRILAQAVEVSEAKETLRETPVSLEVHEELHNERMRHKRLIYDNATKLADKVRIMADQIDKPDELKQLVDANDKLSVTLKVNDRHAPKGDTNVAVSNNTAIQNNIQVEFVGT